MYLINKIHYFKNLLLAGKGHNDHFSEFLSFLFIENVQKELNKEHEMFLAQM